METQETNQENMHRGKHFIKQDRHFIKIKLKRLIHFFLLYKLFFSAKFYIESNS